jgi:predicted HAD superfamily Cof-like phosphohydrolase
MNATLAQMLREFHTVMNVHGGLMPARPTADIPDRIRDLRRALLAEEIGELQAAVLAGDLVEIADAIADSVYVLVGTAVTYGIPFDEVFAEVHRSNMTKINDPAAPKLVKGPDYEPPRIAEILAGAAG